MYNWIILESLFVSSQRTSHQWKPLECDEALLRQSLGSHPIIGIMISQTLLLSFLSSSHIYFLGYFQSLEIKEERRSRALSSFFSVSPMPHFCSNGGEEGFNSYLQLQTNWFGHKVIDSTYDDFKKMQRRILCGIL